MIHCLENGMTFKNAQEAAIHYKVSASAIYQSITKGTRVKGYHIVKGIGTDFTNNALRRFEEVFNECFEEWYYGDKGITEFMLMRLDAYRLKKQKTLTKNTLANRFSRECKKRGIPTPPRSRLNETQKTKYDESIWNKAYVHWSEHGWTLADIAEELDVSEKTVYRHFLKLKGE